MTQPRQSPAPWCISIKLDKRTPVTMFPSWTQKDDCFTFVDGILPDTRGMPKSNADYR